MTYSRKMRHAALTALLLLSGCEVIDDFEVAVSGPHCGKFGIPAELENKELHVLDHRFDWARLDGMIAVLEPYEHEHGPDILWALGVLYLRKASTLSDDLAYYRRGVRLLHWAALCGQTPAVSLLSGIYNEALPGMESDPELGTCLDRAYYLYKDKRELIPGPVWGCGLRMKDVQD
jgi:hypothetical protein